MKVSVRYCPSWTGYDKRALAVAHELSRAIAYNVDVELMKGKRGDFLITTSVDNVNKVLFDKNVIERWPDPGEVLKLVIGEMENETHA